MVRKSLTNAFSLAGLMLLAIGGCRERLAPETPDYVEYGWELMADQEYREAIAQFEAGKSEDDTYADSWNGLGWAFARLGSADTSVVRFTAGANLDDSTMVGTEILAGRSFAKLALGDTNAVADAKAALLSAPNWEFKRDPTLGYLHLSLTVASGFYSWGKFDSCLVWVRKLDDTYNVDVTTLPGRSQLAVKLQALSGEL